MTQCVGDIVLVKFVGLSSDGTVHTLLGWPRQVGSRTTGLSNSVSTRDTEWKPYKLVKVGSQLNDCPQSPFPRGDLKYHPCLGWHYRYFKPFEIPGKPLLPTSMLLNSTPYSPDPPQTPSEVVSKS